MLGCIFSKIVHIYIVFYVLNHTKKEVIDPYFSFGGTKIIKKVDNLVFI
ncbi:hypothetical protein PREVCOP_05655 [Segatella copri DSM 18205]|uniref:Uncharacterized protein n=1 Tax=Segatella copri DSM 18205 TaxID=537011 RepID=D1PEK6_9BACT|nr:hypothetical protein PREVCOP_05655 [Segatella copri DSM 18205]